MIAERGQDVANSNKPPNTWTGKELAAVQVEARSNFAYNRVSEGNYSEDD